MARPKSTTKKVHLNFLVVEEIRDQIHSLQERTKADTLTEVIRRALLVYEACVEAKEKNQVLFTRSRGTGTEREIVIL